MLAKAELRFSKKRRLSSSISTTFRGIRIITLYGKHGPAATLALRFCRVYSHLRMFARSPGALKVCFGVEQNSGTSTMRSSTLRNISRTPMAVLADDSMNRQ